MRCNAYKDHLDHRHQAMGESFLLIWRETGEAHVEILGRHLGFGCVDRIHCAMHNFLVQDTKRVVDNTLNRRQLQSTQAFKLCGLRVDVAVVASILKSTLEVAVEVHGVYPLVVLSELSDPPAVELLCDGSRDNVATICFNDRMQPFLAFADGSCFFPPVAHCRGNKCNEVDTRRDRQRQHDVDRVAHGVEEQLILHFGVLGFELRRHVDEPPEETHEGKVLHGAHDVLTVHFFDWESRADLLSCLHHCCVEEHGDNRAQERVGLDEVLDLLPPGAFLPDCLIHKSEEFRVVGTGKHRPVEVVRPQVVEMRAHLVDGCKAAHPLQQEEGDRHHECHSERETAHCGATPLLKEGCVDGSADVHDDVARHVEGQLVERPDVAVDQQQVDTDHGATQHEDGKHCGFPFPLEVVRFVTDHAVVEEVVQRADQEHRKCRDCLPDGRHIVDERRKALWADQRLEEVESADQRVQHC